MMIGPEPTIRILWRSARLGMLTHQADEIVEQVARIVRPRRGLRMVLDAEYGVISEPETLERLVVEIDVRDLGLAGAERIGIDREAMIMAGDLDLAGQLVPYRVIGAAMAELHLVCPAAHRQAEDLVAEADPEHRYFSDEPTNVPDLRPQ